MGLTNFPNGISSFGVPVLGGGAITTTGSIFFVDSVTGSNGNSGADSDHPFATIDYAIGKCTANKGDHILVMPGHNEAIIRRYWPCYGCSWCNCHGTWLWQVKADY